MERSAKIAPWLAAAALAALATPGLARAEGGKDAPYPLAVKVGDYAYVCPTKTLICPAGAARCDDPSVAVPASGPEGLAFQGVGPGQTLCSAGSSSGMGARQVFLVKVGGTGDGAPKGAATSR